MLKAMRLNAKTHFSENSVPKIFLIKILAAF